MDAAVRLEVNHFNGSIEPRVVLRDLYPLAEREEGDDKLRHDCSPRPMPTGGRGSTAPASAASADGRCPCREPRARCAGASPTAGRRPRSWRSWSRPARTSWRCAPTRAAAPSSPSAPRGSPGSAPRPRVSPAGAAPPMRSPRLSSRRASATSSSPTTPLSPSSPAAPPASATWCRSTRRAQQSEARLVEPPWSERGGYLHPAWGRAERDFALLVAGDQFDLRPHMAGIYRALRAGGPLEGDALRAALEGERRPSAQPGAGRALPSRACRDGPARPPAGAWSPCDRGRIL